MARADSLFKKMQMSRRNRCDNRIRDVGRALTVPSELDMRESQEGSGCNSNKTCLVATEVN